METEEQLDLVVRIAGRLDEAELPFMLTGSLAGIAYGLIRSTNDVNVVIEPNAAALDRFVRLLPPDEFYVSEDAPREALTRRSMFNVIDFRTSGKVDLIVRKRRPFSQGEFERRRTLSLGSTNIAIVSREDLILAKLEWAAQGGSARQLEDVRSLLAQGQVDADYVASWVDALGVRALWDAVR